MSLLQIGAGGVGWAVAHKLAQNNDTFGDLVVASRTTSKCERILASIATKGNLKDPSHTISARTINADDAASLRALIAEARPQLVVNVGPPWINVAVMEA